MSHKSRPNTKALLASLMLLAAPVLDSAVAQDAKDGPIEDIGKGFKMQRIGEIRNVYYAGKMVAHRSDDATFSTEEWSDGVILRIEDPHGLGGEPVTGFYIFQDGEYLTFDVDVHSAGSSSLPATVTLERKGNLVTEHFSRSDGSKAETIYFERKVIARNDGRVPASNAAGDEPGNVGGQAANPPPAVPAKPKSSIRATDNEQLDRIIQAIEERLARPGDSGDQAADTPPAGTPASPAKSKSSVWATDNEQLDRIIQAIEEKLAQEDAEKPKASGPQGSDQGRTSALDGGSNTAANVQSRTAGNEIKPADVSVLGDVQSGPANPPGGAPNKAALDVNEIVTVLSSPDIGQRGVLAKIEAIRKLNDLANADPQTRAAIQAAIQGMLSKSAPSDFNAIVNALSNSNNTPAGVLAMSEAIRKELANADPQTRATIQAAIQGVLSKSAPSDFNAIVNVLSSSNNTPAGVLAMSEAIRNELANADPQTRAAIQAAIQGVLNKPAPSAQSEKPAPADVNAIVNALSIPINTPKGAIAMIETLRKLDEQANADPQTKAAVQAAIQSALSKSMPSDTNPIAKVPPGPDVTRQGWRARIEAIRRRIGADADTTANPLTQYGITPKDVLARSEEIKTLIDNADPQTKAAIKAAIQRSFGATDGAQGPSNQGDQASPTHGTSGAGSGTGASKEQPAVNGAKTGSGMGRQPKGEEGKREAKEEVGPSNMGKGKVLDDKGAKQKLGEGESGKGADEKGGAQKLGATHLGKGVEERGASGLGDGHLGKGLEPKGSTQMLGETRSGKGLETTHQLTSHSSGMSTFAKPSELRSGPLSGGGHSAGKLFGGGLLGGGGLIGGIGFH